MGLLEQIFQAGIVGAGGAGFPTHKKLAPGGGEPPDTLLINAAECEPLLASDRYAMRHFATEIAEALALLKTEFRFSRVAIGTKKKYAAEIAALKAALSAIGAEAEICGLDSFYPAGDEQVLAYEVTGRTVPPGGIPLEVGIVVLNVTTALAVGAASRGIPVTEKYVTVTGEVAEPAIVRAPVGASVADCIAAAGGPRVTPYAIVKGGPMMGKQHGMSEADSLCIGKADGGIVLLPAAHPLIEFAKKPREHMLNQAKSVCMQCSCCTELCPRYLIGHRIRPSRVMRSMATGTGDADLSDALLCCECGLCELHACPMLLSPRRVNAYVKELLRAKGARVSDRTVRPEQAELRGYRRVAQSRLISRLSLSAYPAHIDRLAICRPATVRVPLKHGPGRPASPLVKPGDSVRAGDAIAGVAFEDVGCMVHASISGTVSEVGASDIAIVGGG
ncbi:MAG: SLBB domain-containing protein, partial [Clostridiales bacterium]|nr:SLBB domain-containing protein [Clostridiales bacterium]